ncbi:uncharacterized protein STEHIDRAFT_156672 [Stereum hirsutum FP-91666 SS1]|uniref:uncharacterized protein n=1 Tax=Stereum hirsutum (strain FP-91666) TaxID=721885 RepID=UPI000440D5CA|nr:uncharacterized protein STEHIDRAFT_156672 [Stereum hirsutum FP-91666 SS1]EIM86343.1 hypothetical protein STEHIDRAFT_156672 [Stereum hirsutum FP-91666 SS1]
MCVWGWELGSAGRDGGGRAREATTVERLVQLRTANRRPRSLRLSLWSPPCGRPRVGFRRAPPPLQVPALLSLVLLVVDNVLDNRSFAVFSGSSSIANGMPPF